MAGGNGSVARDTLLANGPSTPARQLTGGSSRWLALCFFSSQDLAVCRNIRDFWRNVRNYIFWFLEWMVRGIRDTGCKTTLVPTCLSGSACQVAVLGDPCSLCVWVRWGNGVSHRPLLIFASCWELEWKET